MTDACDRAWPRVNTWYIFVQGIDGQMDGWVDARTENLKALRNQDNYSLCLYTYSCSPTLSLSKEQIVLNSMFIFGTGSHAFVGNKIILCADSLGRGCAREKMGSLPGIKATHKELGKEFNRRD